MLKQIVLTCSILSTSVNAQQIAGLQNVQTAGVDSSIPSITLESKNTTIARVLEEIAKQAKMHVMLDESNAVLNTSVNVKLKQATLQDALAVVMYGTGARAVIGPDGKTIVVQFARRTISQGIIVGKVTDAKTGKGISGASVSITADNRGVITDENGAYRLSGISTGTHTVTVRLVGYAKQIKSVSVSDGAVIAVDFRLEPSASVLDQVVVTGTVVSTELKAVPSAMTVITAKQIEERGITKIDQLFRGEIPGLFALETGTGSGASVGTVSLDEVVMYSRGATKISGSAGSATSITNPIKTYLDGVELADPQYLSQLDPKSIERIEILTGPQASTIYGANAINGVMQIFTKRGSAVRPSVILNLSEGFAQNSLSSALSSSHQYSGNVSGQEGKVSYNLGSGWDYSGAWTSGKQMQRTTLYGGTRYQVSTLSLDLSARQGWTRNKQQGALAQVATAMVQNGRFVSANNSGVVPPRKLFLVGRTFGVTIGLTPFSWWSHQVNMGSDASDTQSLGSEAGFRTTNDTTLTNSLVPNSRASQSYSSTLRVIFGPFAQATLTYGGDHWRNRYGAPMSWSIRPSGQAVPTLIARPRRTTSKNTGAYFQGQVGLWDALFLTYGLRADWAPVYGERAKVRPGRYGASYSKEFGVISTKLRGSYGRSIKPPDAGAIEGFRILPDGGFNSNDVNFYAVPGTTLYLVLPNPELGAEFQQGGEGGVEIYFANRGSIVITRFNQTVDGLIQNIFLADSVRALQPGRPLSFVTNCDPTSTDLSLSPRSDGYCYYQQYKNLNVGSIRNQGWEMQGSINFGPLTTRGTYSWTKGRVIGITPKYRSLLTDQAFRPGQTFDYVPEHTWAVNMLYAHQETSLSLNVNGLGQSLRRADVGELALYTGQLRLQNQEAYVKSVDLSSIRLPQAGYTTVNLNALHRFSSKFEGILQVTNLTNYYQNDYYYGYPTLGRQTRMGARIRWQ